MVKSIIKSIVFVLCGWVLFVLCFSYALRVTAPLFWDLEGGLSSQPIKFNDSSGSTIYFECKRNMVAVLIPSAPTEKIRYAGGTHENANFRCGNQEIHIVENPNTLVIISKGRQKSVPIRSEQSRDWRNQLIQIYPCIPPPTSILSDIVGRSDGRLEEQLRDFIRQTRESKKD